MVDASTNQPLSGVTVQVSGVGGQGSVTDSTGSFTLSNIPQGTQQISFSLSGYATSTVTVSVTAGSIINIGAIGLSVNPTTGIIHGTVTDASNGQPLSGATITVTGQATWTAATSTDGSYRITDITPGSVTISASKTGYQTVSGAGNITAGGTLVFSPSLSTTAPAPTTGELKGTVVDSSTGAPIQGAVISIAGAKTYNTATDASGSFSITSVEAGAYTLSIAASNYTSQNYTVTISAGAINNMGIIMLILAPTTGTVYGTIKDASTGLPLSDVTITVAGSTTWTAITASDGSYQITNIIIGTVTISAGKTGYYTATGTGVITAGVTLIFSPSLSTTPPTVTTGDLKGMVQDNLTGQPINGATVTAAGVNTYTAAIGGMGEFFLSAMEPGSYTVTITAAGYISQDYTVSIIEGVTTDIGTVKLSLQPTTGTISGTITDAATGAPLEGVIVTAIGAATWQATTSSNGAYQITGVTPGTITVSADKMGYDTVSGTGNVTAGGVLTFSVGLTKIPTTGGLKGTVIDSSTGLPIQGASVSIAGTSYTAATTLSGAFSILSILPGSYTVTITATGYTGQTYIVTIIAGVATDLGTVNLNPQPTVTTITGKVTDSQTGGPIQNADVWITGTGLSTKTDSTGAYTITGIDLLSLIVKAYAAGYNSIIYDLSTSAYGIYTVDFGLSPGQAGADLKIPSLTTDKMSYSANNDISISAAIENTGAGNIETFIIAQIVNPSGEVIAMASPSEPKIILAPQSSAAVNIIWNTDRFSPGEYQIILKVTEPSPVYYNMPGNVFVEKAAPITIEPYTGVADSSLKITPGFTYIAGTESVNIGMELFNRSNIPADLLIEHTIKSPSGVILSSAATPVTLPLDVISTTIPLTTFTYTFTESGEYPVDVVIYKGSAILEKINSIFPVFSNLRIEPNRSVTPQTIIPEGTGKVRITIELKGVEVK